MPRIGILLDEPLVLQRLQQAVDGALRETEPIGELGDAEPPRAAGEGAQDRRRPLDRLDCHLAPSISDRDCRTAFDNVEYQPMEVGLVIGIVLVSHSAPLAEGLADMARQIAGDEVRVLAAGGGPEGTLGTDGDRIATAIRDGRLRRRACWCWSTSAARCCPCARCWPTAISTASRVILADAPLVEGAIAAAATASIGGDLEEAAAPPGRPGMSASSDGHAQRIVRLPDGVDLHARPAGALVRAAAKFASTVTLSAGDRSADAKSILQVLALGATGGTELTVATSGSDASDALEAIADLLEPLA